MKKFFLIVLVVVLCLVSFFAGYFYFPLKSKKYQEILYGETSLKETRKIWGEPYRTYYYDSTIVDAYYSLFGLNKYIFTYNKKDSILVKRWKDW